ncbi:MAG: cytochrome c biogenesis protein ResB [Thermodesulfobacteriota bacterium]
MKNITKGKSSQKEGPGRYLYRKLASIRTAIYILSVLALFFMVGTVFPQGGRLEEYIADGGALPGLVSFLRFLKSFSSPVFLATALILFVNLAVCTYDRFFAARRSGAYRRRFTPTHSILLTQDEAEAVRETHEALRDKLGFREISRQDGWVVMEKGLPYRWLTWLYHAAIAVCLAGVAVTFLFAYEETVTLTPGEPLALEPQARGRITLGSPGPAGFMLFAGRLKTEYAEGPGLKYPGSGLSRLAAGLGWKKPGYEMKSGSTTPVGWKLRLSLVRRGQILKEKLIEINDPLRYGGYTFYLIDFDQVFRLRVNDNPITLETSNGEELLVPGLDFPIRFTIFRTGILKKLDGSVEEIPGYTHIMYSGGEEGTDEDLGKISPGQPMYVNGMKLTLVDVTERPILSYRYDPGMTILWWGGIVVLVTMSLRFLGFWYLAAYRVETTGGISHLDLHIASRGLTADAGKMAARLEHYLTMNDIKPDPLPDE